jgi:hypothetical protein
LSVYQRAHCHCIRLKVDPLDCTHCKYMTLWFNENLRIDGPTMEGLLASVLSLAATAMRLRRAWWAPQLNSIVRFYFLGLSMQVKTLPRQSSSSAGINVRTRLYGCISNQCAKPWQATALNRVW